MAERVLLLHGLWMRRPVLWPLASRLRKQGFEVELFPYATLTSGPERALGRLADRLRSLRGSSAHLVGHSLGGLIALSVLDRFNDLPPGRVVCVGSPIAGSGSAKRLQGRGWGVLAGRSLPLLLRGATIPAGRQVGMIAGDRALGLGRWIAPMEGAGDGTVAVAETRHAALADHCLLPCSHTGLLFAPETAQRCAEFLRSGRFFGA